MEAHKPQFELLLNQYGKMFLILRLGLKGIRVKCRRVVIDPQLADPVQISVHGGGYKPDGLPIVQITSDANGLLLKFFPGEK
jgi:hypothetical protein